MEKLSEPLLGENNQDGSGKRTETPLNITVEPPQKPHVDINVRKPSQEEREEVEESMDRIDENEAKAVLFRAGSEDYVPFLMWQRDVLNWIHLHFSHPVFLQWNYIWHLIVKTPVQLLLYSVITAIGPGTVVEGYYIVILGHVLICGTWIIKDFFQVPRPSWVLPFGFDITISERNWSFPSGHTMGLSGTFLLVALLFGDEYFFLWIVYVVMTFLTCLARTALRMHWPLDTFGSCLMAPAAILPLFYSRNYIFHSHITDSPTMLAATLCVFLIFFLLHIISHLYVVAYYPVPSIVAHIAHDPQKFRYTNVERGVRSSLFLLGIGLGIYTVWHLRDPQAPICPYECGFRPALEAFTSTGSLMLVQNFFRSWWFETKPWTPSDYLIKFIFAPIIGFFAVLNSAGLYSLSLDKLQAIPA